MTTVSPQWQLLCAITIIHGNSWQPTLQGCSRVRKLWGWMSVCGDRSVYRDGCTASSGSYQITTLPWRCGVKPSVLILGPVFTKKLSPEMVLTSSITLATIIVSVFNMFKVTSELNLISVTWPWTPDRQMSVRGNMWQWGTDTGVTGFHVSAQVNIDSNSKISTCYIYIACVGHVLGNAIICPYSRHCCSLYHLYHVYHVYEGNVLMLCCVFTADSTGTHSLFSEFHNLQIMFHVSTMLPFTDNNKQQVMSSQQCYTLLTTTNNK